MRQRNTESYSVTVPSIPLEIGPGEVVDFPEPLMGFELLDEAVPAPPTAAELKAAKVAADANAALSTPVTEAPTGTASTTPDATSTVTETK
jgi:hypothetical protein